MLAESVSIGPIGGLILWAQFKSFEHLDEKGELYYDVNPSYGTAWTFGGECGLWGYSNDIAGAAGLYE
ncbi:hypothetical protein AB0D12_22110 [Streptomyces sp. NPDC048479]|uniref:hypothetical protein n=1 Tax=Streptomyces sp. NPDC048479 TaxID=3154725 RepID=UPI00342D55CE